MKNKTYFGLLACGGLLFLASVYGYQNGWFGRGEPRQAAVVPKKNDSATKIVDKKTEIDKENQVFAGGVVRQKSDLEKQEKAIVLGDKDEGRRLTSLIGHSPKVDPNLNVYTKSLDEARRNPEKFPERLTAMIMPKPFDKEAYLKDPEKYLHQIVPGRSRQDLPPQEGVPALKRTTPLFTKLIQGETVRLEVEATKGMPVTFHSNSLGTFTESQLKTISIKADESGKAAVTFRATKGTYGLVKIDAASPVMSNRVKFLVTVSVPNATGNP